LFGEFAQLADTWSIDQSHWRRETLRTRVLFAVRLGAWARRAGAAETRRFAATCSPALVYTNSIASARAIEVLAARVPVLTHVHELEFQFQALSSPAVLSLVAQSDQFIACSNAVRDNLIHRHKVAPERVETVHSSIPVGDIRAERTRQQVFQELRIPDDALLIAAGGVVTWLKGRT